MKHALSCTTILISALAGSLAQNRLVEEIKPGTQLNPSATPASTPPRAAAVSAISAPAPDPAAEREAYSVANALYLSGKFPEAITQLKAFLSRFPNSPDTTEVQYKLGDALRRTGATAEAEKIFNSIVQSKKNSLFAPFAAMRLAEQRIAQGSIAEALPLLDTTIASAPTTGLRLNALYAKIIALQNLGRISETPDLLDQLTAVRENNPYLPFAELALGRYLESLSDLDAALRHYSRALAQSNTADIRSEAGTRAGIVALRLGQQAEAIRLFDTTLRLDPPENWRLLSQLGLLRAQAAAGDHQNFLRTWDTLNIQLPTALQPEFLYHRANALRSISPPDRLAARQLYTEVVEKHPDSPYAEHCAYELLVLRTADGEPAEKTIPALRNFLTQYANSTHTPMIRYLLARNLAQDGKQTEALPLLLENIKLGQPQQALADMRLHAALALMSSGKPVEALAHLDAILKENPNTPLCENVLHLAALAHEAAGDFDDALGNWDILITRFPNTTHRPLALFRSGLIHARAQRWPETRRAMRSLLGAYPDFPNTREALFWRGLAAYYEGDIHEAGADLTQITQSASKDDSLLIPAVQHLLLIAAKELDLESADPLARRYLHAAQTSKDAPPLSAELILWLASSREKLGQHTDAEYWYEKLLPLAQDKDTKTLALVGLAKARLAIGRGEASLQALDLLLQNNAGLADAPEILLLESRALLATGNPRDALPKAQKVLSNTQEPQLSARARLLVGDIHAALDEHNEALKYYSSTSLLYDDPDVTPEALRKSARTARKLGLTAEAEKFDRELRERFPK